jgi:hypothetical protein
VTNREAQLKAEYRDWYPGLQVGVWYPAAWVREQVLGQLLHGEPRWELGMRVLVGDHFVFRGGDATRPSGPRTRFSD